MEADTLEGKISFVHREKHYVTIEYISNNKKKTVNGKVDEARQLQMKEEKLIKKVHQFHEGDEVYFTLQRSARGDKMVAEKIRYRFNNAIGNLINRARTNNQFNGYLKYADDAYFVKETGSYQFFPLQLSPWEIPPDASKLNEPVFFQLGNLDKPAKLFATLFKQRFIPEFLAARKSYTAKTPVDALIYKISPHGIYLQLMGDKLKAKIPVVNTPGWKEGDRIKVLITYLSDHKIAVEPV